MIVIIDYGMGNLNSVYNALKKLNIPCKISSEIKDIKEAKAMILPGVGAFKDAMDNLERSNLIEVIKEEVSKGKLLLGICLGMQMLFEKSYEIEERQGLGLLKGEVRLMEPVEKVKIPHMGWNSLSFNRDDFKKYINKGDYVYFVHSYYVNNYKEEDLISYCEYGGLKIPAMVRRNNVIGAQFHPEKSGDVGLNILKEFGEMIL